MSADVRVVDDAVAAATHGDCLRIGFLVFAMATIPSPGWSDQVFTEDVVIQNADPALIFDDTSTAADGFEYVIRGRDELFSIRDDALGRTHLFIDTAQRSIALGDNAQVTAANGAALGRSSTVTGNDGVAVGLSAAALNTHAAALGPGASASGNNSLSAGYSSEATQNSTVAIGAFSSATGGSAIAIGSNATSSLTSSIAIGTSTMSYADFSAAIGYQAVASAEQGSALGFVTKALAARSSAIGFRAYADQPDTLILGAIKDVNSAGAYSNIGIGTSNPIQAVDVERSGEAARFQLTSFTNVSTEAPQYIQRRARGVTTAPTAVLNNDNLGLFSFRGHNGTTMGGSRATITAQAAGNFTTNSTPTRLIFATTPVGETVPQQVLVITPDGKVQVNGQNLNVPDYVFEDNYELMPLDELRAFIDANGHLPGIAPADEVNANGLDLAGSQMDQLRKIEELTLYTLQLQELVLSQNEQIAQLQALKSHVDTQQAQLEIQRERIGLLEAMLAPVVPD